MFFKKAEEEEDVAGSVFSNYEFSVGQYSTKVLNYQSQMKASFRSCLPSVVLIVRNVRWRKPARYWVEGFKTSIEGESFSGSTVSGGRAWAERPPTAAHLQRARPVHLQPAGVRLGNPPLLRRELLSRRTKDPVFRDEPRTFRHGADRGKYTRLTHDEGIFVIS